MNQWHEDLLLHPQEILHRFLHLGVLSPEPHLPQALIDPLGRVALFLRQGFVFFDDLSDPLKIGTNLRFGAGAVPRFAKAPAGRQTLLQDNVFEEELLLHFLTGMKDEEIFSPRSPKHSGKVIQGTRDLFVS